MATEIDDGYLGPYRYNPTADEVFTWPEFRAFAKRLGILMDVSTTNLVIHLSPGMRILVEQLNLATDMGPEKED